MIHHCQWSIIKFLRHLPMMEPYKPTFYTLYSSSLVWTVLCLVISGQWSTTHFLVSWWLKSFTWDWLLSPMLRFVVIIFHMEPFRYYKLEYRRSSMEQTSWGSPNSCVKADCLNYKSSSKSITKYEQSYYFKPSILLVFLQ